MTEKRQATEALFRKKINAKIVKIFTQQRMEGVSAHDREAFVSIFLDGARFAVSVLRELEAEESVAQEGDRD